MLSLESLFADLRVKRILRVLISAGNYGDRIIEKPYAHICCFVPLFVPFAAELINYAEKTAKLLDCFTFKDNGELLSYLQHFFQQKFC